jgi:hypothetical protein
MSWSNWLQYVPTILPLPLAYARNGKEHCQNGNEQGFLKKGKELRA